MKSFKGKTKLFFSILEDQDINLRILASTIDFYTPVSNSPIFISAT